VFIKYESIGSSDIVLELDENLASQYINILAEISDKFKIKNDVSVMKLAELPGVVATRQAESDVDLIWGKLSSALKSCLINLKDMRAVEGRKLAEDVNMRSDTLEGYIEKVEEYSDTVVEDYRVKLSTRINEILENENLVDEARLAQEVAIFADKSSITEEIVRFKSHIIQLRDTVAEDKSIGRKLDFLIQEMNRETNTIGSKSSDINITNLVVEIKSELEKIREQIQNIE
jgi:uncharacterized protein (TIGR00255 family)